MKEKQTKVNRLSKNMESARMGRLPKNFEPPRKRQLPKDLHSPRKRQLPKDLHSPRNRRAYKALSILAFFALVLPTFIGGSSAHAADVNISLITFNDFHGRIVGDYGGTKPTDSATWLFADTLLAQKDKNPNGSIIASAGDNVGASLFASSIQNDEPTMHVMNELPVDVSAAGNHEFDKGIDDFKNRIIPFVQSPYLVDNIYKKGTKTPLFPESNLSYVRTLNGIKVGFVGAVTSNLPNMVMPSYFKDADVGDPVEAVNREAKKLVDSKAADIVVALYHEGAEVTSSLNAAKADSPIFKHIVDDTDPSVKAIVTAHTHMKYAWQDPNHGNRPIIQASCYGQDIGDIELSVDTATKQVTNSSVTVIPTRTLADVDRATEMANPDYGSELHKISAEADAAQEYADIVGKTEIGSVSAPLTRAFTGCEYVDNVYTCPSSAQKDKANDSPLGRLFAQAYKWQAQKTSDEPIDFGVVQAGAVRADIYPNENGKATYSDILSASPFANSLFELQMTGAQIKTMLEQQWLRLTVPDSSSPFEMLSFSDDVSYTLNTNDPSATPGNHVLSIYIHGKPIDMKKVYVVATSSFLASGGDGFLAFKNTIQKDVGFTDTDSLLNYVKEQTASGKGIAPNYAHSSAVVSSEIPKSVKPGQSLKQKVYGVNMTSVGSPRNTEVKVYLGGAGGNAAVSSVVSGGEGGNAEVSSVVSGGEGNNVEVGGVMADAGSAGEVVAGGGSGSAGEVVAGGVMAVGQAPSEVPLGTVSIGSDNIANVDVVVPKSVANGDYTLKYVFTDSGTTILQPLKVASVAPTPTPTPTPTPPTPTPPTPSPTPSPNPPVPAHTGVSLDAAIALLLIFGICGISGVVVVRRKTSTKNMANV